MTPWLLNELYKINEEDSLWKGECFVFDDRVSINHKLQVGSYDLCHGCRMPITESDKNSEHYERGISCPNCFNRKTPDQKKRYAERQKQVDLAKLRNEKHIGANFALNKKWIYQYYIVSEDVPMQCERVWHLSWLQKIVS